MMQRSHSQVRYYRPQSVLREPKNFVRHAIHDFFASFNIAWAIFYRDFSAKYRQTFAGYFSAIVPVLVTTISFAFLEKTNVINFNDTQIDYISFVFINTIFWELFLESCTGPTREIQNNISSIIRLNFPRESIFFANILNVMWNFGLKIFVALIFSFALKVQFTANLFYLIPLLFGFVIWGSLIGLLVLPISILYSDFKLVVDIGLRFLFFLTPITYQIDYASMGHSWIPKINILTYFFTAFKEIVFLGQTPAHLSILIAFSLTGSAFIFIGWILYRISLPILIERMPS